MVYKEVFWPCLILKVKQSLWHLPILQSVSAIKIVPSGRAQFNLDLNITVELVINALLSPQKCCWILEVLLHTSAKEPHYQQCSTQHCHSPWPAFLVAKSLGLLQVPC